jgi:hypothetical protein
MTFDNYLCRILYYEQQVEDKQQIVNEQISEDEQIQFN